MWFCGEEFLATGTGIHHVARICQLAFHRGSSESHTLQRWRRTPAFPQSGQWIIPPSLGIFAKLMVAKAVSLCCFICIALVKEIEQLSECLSTICIPFSVNWTFVSTAWFLSVWLLAFVVCVSGSNFNAGEISRW